MLLTEAELKKQSLAAKRRFLDYWFKLQKNDYLKSFTVKERERVFHVSPCSTIRKFFPKIPNFVKPGEDNTIARICTSNNVTDAVIGMIDTQFERIIADEDVVLTIYGFEPALSLKPTKRPLPNSSNLNERWIVNYDPTHSDYESQVWGKIVIKDVLKEKRKDGKTIFDAYITLNDYAMIKEGYEGKPDEGYRVTISTDWEDGNVVGKNIEITPMSKSDILQSIHRV